MTEVLNEVSGPDELRQLNQAFPARYPFLLQSTTRGGNIGRFDILFACPGDSLVLQQAGSLSGNVQTCETQFLPALDRWWSEERLDTTDSLLPFHGGWFLYLGYELAQEIEPGLSLYGDTLLPTAFAVRCPAALIFDHAENSCALLREENDPVAYEQLLADIADIAGPATNANESNDAALTVVEEPAQHFTSAVDRAKEHIAAGDIYQANLSRQWSATVAADLSSENIYAALCKANPGPFAGIAHWQDVSIISSSPERLLQVRDGTISTRPIAGTRPRDDDSGADSDLSTELFAHPKERAEHVMLIDLERNDIGRVCEAGTVEVDEMMILESYAHVHHIVSNIRGQLRADVTPGAAIAAVFPGGTITGCPKVRCMEIINELEEGPRGAYTGSFGYLNRDGSMDLNILIRTIVAQGNSVSFRAGAGIVADSEPAAELEETRAKAKGMLRALSP